MTSKKCKTKTLSEKVTETFIPEKISDIDNDSDTGPKIADFYEDEDDENIHFSGRTSVRISNLSNIRKNNVKMLSDHSDKYRGKISSRTAFSMESDDANIDEEDTLKNCKISNYYITDPNETEENSGNDVSEEIDSDYDSNSEVEDLISEDQNIMLENSKIKEIEKGVAVQNQLKIWERLLELRIHSQKLITKANSLPLPEHFQQIFKQHKTFSKLARETSKNVENLLEKLLDIQYILGKQNSKTKTLFKLSRKRSAMEETVTNELPSKRFASELEVNLNDFKIFQNSILSKWDDRTKLLIPGASSKKKNLLEDFDVVKRIENILLSKHELIEKSQKVKGTYQLFGLKESDVQKNEQDDNYIDYSGNQKNKDVSCVDIYDDTDFYHQQLRELIEFKSNTSENSAELTKQFAELQKIRHKMKKKMDSRASKGRQIRYAVHKKLVNFMTPQDDYQWTDDSKNELYRSVFAT